MVEINLRYEGGFHCAAVHGPSNSVLETDAPTDNMGKGEAFSPTDLLATSLGTCIATTMAIFAKRLGVDIAGTTVRVRKHMSAEPPRRVAILEVDVAIPLQPDHPNRAEIEAAGRGCPVMRSIHPDIEVPDAYRWTGT